MEYHFEERLHILQCLKFLLSYWQDPRHPYRVIHCIVKHVFHHSTALILRRNPTFFKLLSLHCYSETFSKIDYSSQFGDLVFPWYMYAGHQNARPFMQDK